jgi:hypothetical protein
VHWFERLFWWSYVSSYHFELELESTRWMNEPSPEVGWIPLSVCVEAWAEETAALGHVFLTTLDTNSKKNNTSMGAVDVGRLA